MRAYEDNVSDQGSVQTDLGNGVVRLAVTPSSSMIITNRVEPRKLLNEDSVGGEKNGDVGADSRAGMEMWWRKPW
jgi:hypothetical protein